MHFFESQLESQVDPEVVYLGTSRTMNNVCTQEINRLSVKDGLSIKHLNLGVNWSGLDIGDALANEWLNKKHPKILVLEVPFLYRYSLHPNFDKVASPASIFCLCTGAPWMGLQAALVYAPRALYQSIARQIGLQAEKDLYDRQKYDGQVRVDLNEQQLKSTEENIQKLLDLGPVSFAPEATWKFQFRKLLYFHQMHMLEQMSALCKEKGIRLVLLALPKVRINELPPELDAHYRSLGQLIIPPYDLVQHAQFWRDQSHMNTQGAMQLAPWIHEQIKQIFLTSEATAP